MAESVWSYPRPPRVEPTSRRIEVVHRGVCVARSTRALRVLETSHPPVYFVPREDVAEGVLRPRSETTWCEFKGRATYFDVVVDGAVAEAAAFSYPDPTPAFAAIAGHVAFYASRLDRCLVDGEPVEPQPGGFYAGWITPDLQGPFKGGPGTMGW